MCSSGRGEQHLDQEESVSGLRAENVDALRHRPNGSGDLAFIMGFPCRTRRAGMFLLQGGPFGAQKTIRSGSRANRWDRRVSTRGCPRFEEARSTPHFSKKEVGAVPDVGARQIRCRGCPGGSGRRRPRGAGRQLQRPQLGQSKAFRVVARSLDEKLPSRRKGEIVVHHRVELTSPWT